jgi:hypothetical protein
MSADVLLLGVTFGLLALSLVEIGTGFCAWPGVDDGGCGVVCAPVGRVGGCGGGGGGKGGLVAGILFVPYVCSPHFKALLLVVDLAAACFYLLEKDGMCCSHRRPGERLAVFHHFLKHLQHGVT